MAPAFPIPKEQFPSRRFFSLLRQPGNTRLAGVPPTLSFFWARNAIFYSLKALGISDGAHILLPAYLCRAAVEPFEVFGADLEFYPIGRGCELDLLEIEARIKPCTEAILVVHYFGFPQPINRLRALCDRRSLYLIEDCAHVLQGSFKGQRLGTFGDASVFSWRKFLPIYDGGDLWLRKPFAGSPPTWQKESFPFTLKSRSVSLTGHSKTPQEFSQTAFLWQSNPLRPLRSVFEASLATIRSLNSTAIGRPSMGHWSIKKCPACPDG